SRQREEVNTCLAIFYGHDFILRLCGLAIFIAYDLSWSVIKVYTEREVDEPFLCGDDVLQKCRISLMHLMFDKLVLDKPMGFLMLGQYKYARGRHIQAVYDDWSRDFRISRRYPGLH